MKWKYRDIDFVDDVDNRNLLHNERIMIPLLNAVSTSILLVFIVFVSCSGVETTMNAIDEDVHIKTEDTRLFANLRSVDSLSPVLIYLHGGPGSPLGIPIFKAYAGHHLEQDFIIVYLHQRGIMKSDRVADSTHTISNYVRDIHHVVNYLKSRFKDREVFMIGHSWGGLLAYLYQMEYENEVDRFVTVCSPLNVNSMIYGRIDMMMQWASETDNQLALDELGILKTGFSEEIPGNSEVLKKWMTRAYGGWHRNLDMKRVNMTIDYEENLSEWLEDQKHIESLLLEEILKINLSGAVHRLFTPLLCIAGKEDTNSPWYILKEELEGYGGTKEFRLFENSHHMVFIDEEKLFVETVTDFLKSE